MQYTAKNLEFAASVDPNNEALKKKAAWVKETREQGHPTVPSTIGGELDFNPFMRVESEALKVRPLQLCSVCISIDAPSLRTLVTANQTSSDLSENPLIYHLQSDVPRAPSCNLFECIPTWTE